jgi:hypothetical protein
MFPSIYGGWQKYEYLISLVHICTISNHSDMTLKLFNIPASHEGLCSIELLNIHKYIGT